MFRPGLVLTRTARKLDALSAEILLGGEGVVGAAAQREIGFGVLASVRECRHMVELEAVSLRATPSRVVSVGAAPSVAHEDGAPDGSGDVCTAPARVLADERDLMPYDLLDTIERAAIRDKHPLREIFPQYEPSFHLDDESLDPKYRFQFLWGGFEREFEELRDALGLE